LELLAEWLDFKRHLLFDSKRRMDVGRLYFGALWMAPWLAGVTRDHQQRLALVHDPWISPRFMMLSWKGGLAAE
jgi:hypothetical protein